VQGEPLRVRSAPALPIVDPLLPFSVLDAAAGNARPAYTRALPAGEDYLELPPATPVRRNGTRETAGSGSGTIVAGEQARLAPAPAAFDEPVIETPTSLSLALDEAKLDWMVRYLDEARFEGVVSHLMVIRALFPDTAETPAATERLREHGAKLNELVDRLFIKLRLPNQTLVRDDLETWEYRESFEALLASLRSERGRDIEMRGGLTISSWVEPRMLSAAEEDLRHSKIVTAAPWHAASMLIATSLERDGQLVASFGSYREALLRQFWSMRDLSPTEFEAALHKPGDVELEVEREDVIRTLTAQRRVPA
jgi:hypothetical protein